MGAILGSVGTGATNDGTAATATHDLLAGGNRAVFAVLGHESTTDRAHGSCYYDTGGDNTLMTKVPDAEVVVDTGSVENRMSIWVLYEKDLPTTLGNKTVTGTAGGATVGGIGIAVFCVEDIKSAVEDVDTAIDAGSVTHIDGTITATLNAIMICCINHSIDTAAQTPDSPQVELLDEQMDNDFRFGISYEICTAEGSQTLGGTAANPGHVCCSVFSYKHIPSGVVGISSTPVLMM